MNELVRCVDTFAATQLPIFMTLSSQGDTPNQVLFPIGQSLSAFSRAARSNRQWLTMVQSIGTYRSYHSHVLKSRPGRKAMTASGAVGSCLCQQNLSAVSRPLLAELQDLFTALADGTYPAELDLGNSREFAYSRLEAQTTLSPHIPFMVVSVDKAIIPNHGDIFTPEIVDFLLEYIALIQHKRTQVGTPPRK